MAMFYMDLDMRQNVQHSMPLPLPALNTVAGKLQYHVFYLQGHHEPLKIKDVV